ncbi:hypothetical protein WJX72_003798 [[Myrmecia] bisecta]|uniref:Uncharacterized protein n=1 Tax=[Myrmecia] bisecta TaxID=41462 RepID=A0AAW1PSL5_9CHLO
MLLVGIGAFVLGTSLAVFLIASIPTVLAARRTAQAMEVLLRTAEAELPDTVAAMRLSGLELSDCIEEVSLLSGEVTSGIRASAQAVTAAEQGIREGAKYARMAVTDMVVPTIKRRVPAARGTVEAELQRRAQLQHTLPAIRQMAATTKTVASQLRFGLAALKLVSGANQARRWVLQQRGLAEYNRRREYM